MRILVLVAAAGPLLGASGTWIGGFPTNMVLPYPWNNNSNWTASPYPNGPNDIATFQLAGTTPPFIVDVNGIFQVNQLSFTSTTQFTIVPDTIGNGLIFPQNSTLAPSIRVSSGTHVIDVPIVLGGLFNFIKNTGTSLTMNQPISESVAGVPINVGITAMGITPGGSTFFAAPNSYTGPTDLYSGTLALIGDGSIATSSSLFLQPTATAQVFDISQISASSTTIQDLGGMLTSGSNTIQLGNKNLTFGTSTPSTIYQGDIAGNLGSLTKQGSGSFSFQATNQTTYFGPTIVNEGTFAGNNDLAFSPNSDYTLNGSSTLLVNGSSLHATILSLTGQSNTTVSAGTLATLILTNGGNFLGTIQNGTGTLGIAVGDPTAPVPPPSPVRLNLYGNNRYSLGTFVFPLATIGVGSNSALGSGDLTLVGGILQALTNVSLSNPVILGPGNNTIDVQNYQMTLSGNITDSNPVSILGSSAGLLILSGNNTYSGSTTLTNGVSLQAGSTSALSPNSSFILAGTSTLDLHGFNNTVMQLSSTTTSTLVTNSGTNNATLTVSSGGAYYGLITDGFTNKTALSLTGSLLTLFSPNTYSGVTTISGSGELRALAQNAFSPNSLVNLTSANAILNLNGFNNTIAGLQGTTGTVNLGSNSTLTINGGLTTTFSGQIINAPCGSLVIDGNTNLTLNGTNNLYCGSTNIIKGTLNILAGGALSPNSNIQVQPLGNLSVNGAFTNNVPSLTTSGSVVNTGQSTLFLNTLTISNGTFVNNLGSIFSLQTTISGGTVSNINGGSIAGNAPGSSLSITGGVVSNGSICTAATGSIGDLTTSISFTGGVLNTNYHVIGSSYTQGPNATLNLTMCTVPSKFGQILADGVISLNGTLIVTAPPSFTPSPESFFPLVFKPAATSGIPTFSGQFSSIQLQGFSATPPARVITAVPHIGTGAPENIVTLYFAACVSSWNSAQSGLWSDNTKWLPPCVPGITLPPEVPIATNDEAIFPNVGSSAVTITLSYTNPLTPPQSVPISPVLLIMDFTANTTSYTINPFPAGGSQLIFDATPSFPSDAQILVEAGSHTINAPILLNIPTDLLLTDRAQLTFGSTVTMQSGTSVGGFFVAQGLSSTLGTGRLINQGTLSPAFFTFESATIQNNQGSFITPTGNFSMNPISGHTAHLINSGTLNPAANLLLQGSGTALIDNSGTGAIIGSSQPNSTFLLDGSGSIVIQNSGTGATFGGSGNSGLFLVSSSGPVTLNNTGAIATLGPTGAGSQFVVNGTGPIFLNNTGESASLVASGSGATFLLASPSATVLNQGLNVLMGAPGPDGNVIIQAGVIQNLLGAIFQAGDGGQLTMTGGTLTNDFTSTVGSLNQNILFSGGSLVNSGAIYAFDYTQEAPANLTLTLISASTHGFVHASGMLNLAGTLNVEALPGLSISNSDVIVLLEGDRDRIGTFSTVNLSGFPSNLIPSVYYSPTAVELLFSSSVTPSGNGTVTTFALSSITAFNILIGRENTLLHEWMYDRCYDPCYDHCKEKPFHKGKNDPCAQNDQLLFTARETPRKTQQLHDESESRRDRPWRIYMGPIGSVGSLDTIESQPGCDYTSFGLFAGIDHAGSNLGLGLALDYENMTGDLHKGAGHLHVHQIRVNGYANLMLKNLPELSLMAIGGGGYDWYSLGRTAGPTTAPITARSSPRGTEYDIFFGLEYIFAHKKFHMIPKGLRIVPMANIQYIGVSIDKFREKKGGTFSLRVDNQFRDSLRSYLGTRLDYTVGSSCCQLQTEFDLGWQREYLDHDFTLDASTASIMPTRRVEIPVFGLGRDTFLGGIDLLLTIYEAFQVEASYDLQWNSRLINNSVYLGIGGRF